MRSAVTQDSQCHIPGSLTTRIPLSLKATAEKRLIKISGFELKVGRFWFYRAYSTPCVQKWVCEPLAMCYLELFEKWDFRFWGAVICTLRLPRSQSQMFVLGLHWGGLKPVVIENWEHVLTCFKVKKVTRRYKGGGGVNRTLPSTFDTIHLID